LIRRVRRGSSAVMPAPIYLTILLYSSPSGFQGRRMQQVCKAISGQGTVRDPYSPEILPPSSGMLNSTPRWFASAGCS
jgi:hypothetical protein